MTMLQDTIEIVQGDSLPVISGVLFEDDGVTPKPIAGYTITLHIGYATPKVKTASIPVGTDGKFTFGTWADGDLVAGEWEAEIKVVSPSGKLTFRKNEQGRKLRLIIPSSL